MSTRSSQNSPRRALYLVTIWVEPQTSQLPIWRGSLEAADGKRMYFTTLAGLNHVLTETCGWVDPVPAEQMLADSGAGRARGDNPNDCFESKS